MANSTVPTHRVRGKSAPRGRSPDPKSLKKAAKAAKERERRSKKEHVGLVTPPPKTKTTPSSSQSSAPKESCRKRISFGPDTVHEIDPENKTNKDMKIEEADQILASLKKDPTPIIFV